MTTVGLALALLNLVLHLGIGGVVLHQVRWRLGFPAWRRAWCAFGLAWTCALVFRLDDLQQAPTYWRMLLATPMTTGLWYGMHILARLFREAPFDDL